MRLFDTHTHLDDEAFDVDRETLLQNLPLHEVTKVLLCGANMESSRRVMALQKQTCDALQMVCAVGIHPHDADTLDDAALEELRRMLQQEGVVALGEIGLDYYYDLSPRLIQQEAMLRQIGLANAAHKPIIFHIRDAWGDFFTSIQHCPPQRANMHCWSGSVESARRCLDMGMMISFSGSVTFKNAHNLREVAAYVPDNRLLIETDCPYLTPVPFRGKRNSPLYVGQVAQCLAQVRGCAEEEIAELTWENGTRFFSEN